MIFDEFNPQYKFGVILECAPPQIRSQNRSRSGLHHHGSGFRTEIEMKLIKKRLQNGGTFSSRTLSETLLGSLL